MGPALAPAMMMLGLLALVALVVAGAVGPAVSNTTKCVRPLAKMFTSPHKTDDADLTHRP